LNTVAATLALGPALPPPADRRAPFGLRPIALTESPLLLRWTAAALPPGPLTLRITTAIDDRSLRLVRVATTRGRPLGQLDLRYAHALQTFSLPLPADLTVADFAEGLALTLSPSDAGPLWIAAPADTPDARAFTPHLAPAAPPADPAAALLDHLREPACVHAWGWMEGCVLDGLERLAAVYPKNGYDLALRRHLARFFPADGRLLAETPRGVPHDDAIDNIESTLMFAPLAAVDPAHPWLDRVTAYWRRESSADGAVLDGAMLSAEGSYTIAYPMARLARLRGDAALATAALRQLEVRRTRLWHDAALWLRWFPADDSRTFRNWARGITWHFLGSVRTAQELDGDARLAPVLDDLRRLADLALRTQRADGLWNCFLDDDATTPDTSGSAGLAAALALAARHRWIEPAPARAAAARAWSALLAHVVADGRLGGVSQANRGGETLQRADYRVLSAMGAGLAAQLHAALTCGIGVSP
jgi:rhamnogalacturonyl hydrolase YesR